MENQETTTQPTLLNHAIRWGLILGGVGIVLTILCYAIDYTIMVQLKFIGIILLVYLALVIYAGIDFRKTQGGFLSYGKAFQHGFIVLAISGLIGALFQLILYSLIDPELPQKLVDASLENTRAMMEKFGMPEDKMDEALEKAKTDTADRFTIIGQAKGYLFGLIFYVIVSSISSLFVRKNQPVEM